MAELGYISTDEADRAARHPDVPHAEAVQDHQRVHVVLRAVLLRLRPADNPHRPGSSARLPSEREAFLQPRRVLTIRTTLDPKAQSAAFEAVTSTIPIKDPSRRAAAISMVEPGTGNILAMAQNRDWGTSGRGNTTYNYNVERAMGGTIGMQAGSTFKVFTLAAALETGISPYEYDQLLQSQAPSRASRTAAPARSSPRYTCPQLHDGRARFTCRRHGLLDQHLLHRPRAAHRTVPTGRDRRVHGRALGNGDPLLPRPVVHAGHHGGHPARPWPTPTRRFANHGLYCKPRRHPRDQRPRGQDALPVPTETARASSSATWPTPSRPC